MCLQQKHRQFNVVLKKYVTSVSVQAVAQMVEAVRYQSEGRRFKPLQGL
jgi:hypothetical protein